MLNLLDKVSIVIDDCDAEFSKIHNSANAVRKNQPEVAAELDKQASIHHMYANKLRLVYSALADIVGYNAASAMLERGLNNPIKRKV